MSTEVYALSSEEERQLRRAELRQPHVAPLTTFVGKIRAETGLGEEVPWFDPRDGGVGARVLFLLQAPGPGAIQSGFVSRANRDQSAKNFCELLDEAGIPPAALVIWNIVPWALRDEHGNVRGASAADLQAALAYLEECLSLLPRLQAVVLMGGAARSKRAEVESLTDSTIFESYLCSPRVLNSSAANRGKILHVLREVAAFIGVGDGDQFRT